MIQVDGQDRLYFVVETKASTFEGDLRGNEIDKMDCGEKHFEALAVGENPAQYKIETTLDDLLAKI